MDNCSENIYTKLKIIQPKKMRIYKNQVCVTLKSIKTLVHKFLD